MNADLDAENPNNSREMNLVEFVPCFPEADNITKVL